MKYVATSWKGVCVGGVYLGKYKKINFISVPVEYNFQSEKNFLSIPELIK